MFDDDDEFGGEADDFLEAGRSLGEQILKIDRTDSADVYVDMMDPTSQVEVYRNAVNRAL